MARRRILTSLQQDVLPIMQKNCQSCHRPGEIGRRRPHNEKPRARGPRRSARRCSPRRCRRGSPIRVSATRQRPQTHRSRRQNLGGLGGCGPRRRAIPKTCPPPIEWRDGWNIKPDLVIGNAQNHTMCLRGHYRIHLFRGSERIYEKTLG